MKIQPVLWSLFGGACVYVAAACGTADSAKLASSSVGGGGAPGDDGGSGASVDDSGSIFDALPELTLDVREAQAQAAPTVQLATCNTVGTGASVAYFAETSFPGKTKIELAGVVALLQGPAVSSPVAGAPDISYDTVQVPAYVKDGSAMARCAQAGMLVTFVLR